jgi:hypothetical protein
MKSDVSSHFPPEILEERAEKQRGEIEKSVTELKAVLRETVRERLDVNRYARRHLWQFASLASVLALAGGYGFGGIFSRR